MDAEHIYEVVMKLTRDIRPHGCSNHDRESNENLKQFIEVFAKMHTAIDDVAYDFKDRCEASVKDASNIACKHLDSMHYLAN